MTRHSVDNIENNHEGVNTHENKDDYSNERHNSNPVNNQNNVAQDDTEPAVTTRTGRTSNKPIRLIANILQEMYIWFCKILQEADTGRLNLYQEVNTFENIEPVNCVRKEYSINNTRVIVYVMFLMTNKFT